MPPDDARGIFDWEGDVVLADGATVHIRALRADDEPLLARMYERMINDSVYLRFFSPVPRATATALEMRNPGRPVTSPVALLGGEIVAPRYDVRRDGVAEVALAVTDEHQGRGVGTLLLEHLAVIARSQGVHLRGGDPSRKLQHARVFAAAGWARLPLPKAARSARRSHRAERVAAAIADRQPRGSRVDGAPAGSAPSR